MRSTCIKQRYNSDYIDKSNEIWHWENSEGDSGDKKEVQWAEEEGANKWGKRENSKDGMIISTILLMYGYFNQKSLPQKNKFSYGTAQ